MSKVFTITEGLENLGALRTGGQGSVYKGRRTGTIYTAVKLIPTPISTENQDDKNYRNFQNEVAKLQKVNEKPNPNVVKILSSGITESGSFPFIEMEYIEGPDLCELLQPPHPKVFLLKELIKVADQLAGALAHCHNVGVKHGDIKSNNVKYNIHTGNYVLLDFGLAIMSEEQRRSSIRHAGAIEFMAPEQNEGKMLLQTDVYSYGIILYELLTGQVPFPLHGNSDTGRNAVMLAHMEGQVPDAMALRRSNLPADWSEAKKAREMQVPNWLLDVINKCLQKQPEDRYAGGKELQKAIVGGSLSITGAAELKAAIPVIENTQLVEETVVQDDPSKVVLSKPVFATIITLLVIFMLFSGYSAFIKKDGRYMGSGNVDSLQTDTSAIVNDNPTADTVESYKPPVKAPEKPNVDSIIEANVRAKVRADSIAREEESLKPDTASTPEGL
ncbi:MAG: serine/threonine protein kinase [Sphingobacteriales bacterium]|nr:MAG: serine/threonine protein kinase [Sphingobacteriales bacterium]